MKFVSLNGRVDGDMDSSYISITVEDGDNQNSIGDQVWFSKDGTEMEILDHADQGVYDEVKEMFDGNSKRAFKGAMLRMDVEI